MHSDPSLLTGIERQEETPITGAAHSVSVAASFSQSEASSEGWRLFKQKDFLFLWVGQSISQIGDGINKVALLWFVYTLTGSALMMTVVGLLQTLPPLVLGPLIGVYLDRLPKKPVMICIDLIQAVLILLIPVLHAAEVLTLEGLYALVFLIAVFGTVFGPALASAVPLVVPRPQLTAANALLQSTANIGVLAGPAISGLGISLFGAQNVLYADAACNLISALLLMPIRVRETIILAGQPGSPGTVMADLLLGVRFVFIRHRMILNLMITSTLYTVAASAFIFLLPVYAKQGLQVGPVELGWLWSGLGIGMLGGSVWLVWMKVRQFEMRFRIMSISMAIGGFSVALLSAQKWPPLAALLLVIIGASKAMFMPIVWAMLQELTPDNLRGRVFTTFSVGGMAAAMVGMAGFGWMADRLGPEPSILGAGAFLIAAAISAEHLRRHGAWPSDPGSLPPACTPGQ